MTAGTAAVGSVRPTRGAPSAQSVFRRPIAVAAVVYLVVVVVAAVAAPVLAPYDPTATDLHQVLGGPSLSHPLGADGLGRDVLSRLMYGGRVSLAGVVEAVVTVLVLGVLVGLLAGFLGRLTDQSISWAVDIVMAIPAIVILLVVLAVVGQNETAAMITFGVLGAPVVIRVVRGATLAVRNELYVAAAKVLGLSNLHIMIKHVLPRVIGPVIVQASIFAGTALLAETGIGFLGLGVQQPDPTWGNMVAEASTVINQQPWLLVPSGLAIGLSVLAFGILGDALRDATAERGERAQANRRRPVRSRASRPAEAEGGDVDSGSMDALLHVRGVTVELPAGRDDPASVVEAVDLRVDRGEAVGVVGESGCGKSMIGRAILGLLPAGGQVTEGRIVFDGRDLTRIGSAAMRRLRGSEIALISQEPVASLDPVFTVGAQLDELVRRHYPGPARGVRSRTLSLLEIVNLRDPDLVAHRYPHQLSGGMAQRVAIAMALVGEPKLLIADEPTTALDATVQAEILDLLRSLRRKTAMAILLISHDWGVVADFCERAYVMYAGHIMETAAAGKLVERPRHPYTAALLGSSPRGAERRTRLPAIGGVVPEPWNRPEGCRFHPRCARATAECTTKPIPMIELDPGHRTRCIHHGLVPEGGGNDGAQHVARRL